jgi:TonB family protein
MALVAASMPASAPARDTGQGDSVFFEFQVEHPATLASGNTPPAYPIALRAAGINGRVLVSFVVDTNGRAEMTTLKVLQVGDSRFFDAVRDHLPDMIFIPAEIGVQKVRQLVQMPFVFTLGDIGANTGGRTQPLFVVDGVPLNPDAAARMPTAAAGDSAYFEFQVERQVSAASGNTPPAYPPELRAARIEGRVLVSFVVGTDGRADMSTFKVVRTTHDLFSKAVRDHLPDMIFIPAQIGGHDVKQVVQMPFVFTLNP